MAILSRLQTWLNLLTTNPLGFLVSFVTYALSILIALIFHETAHGWVAYRCGDPTAKIMGRLSLNPARHLDLTGTLCMVFLGFGWAKPVPINPRNFRNGRRDDFLVSIAGILANLTIFILSLLLYVLLYALTRSNFLVWYQTWFTMLTGFFRTLASINLSLAIFNLLPIPPLDGFHLLNDTILQGRVQLNRRAFNIAFIVLSAICLTGVLNSFLNSVLNGIWSAVLNLFLRMVGMA